MKKLTFLFISILIMLSASLIVMANTSDPPPEAETITLTEDVHFELRHTTTWSNDCRYDLYVVTPTESSRVGYIKDSCSYSEGVLYLMKVDKQAPDDDIRTRHSLRDQQRAGSEQNVYRRIEQPPGAS